MAPPMRRGRPNKKSDTYLSSAAKKCQEASLKDTVLASSEDANPHYDAKRKSRLRNPFKTRDDLVHTKDSFIAVLKKNARDLTIKVTSNDELVLSFKTTKRDLGIFHATKNQVLLPWKKSESGCITETSQESTGCIPTGVRISGIGSDSKSKVSSFSIMSDQIFKLTTSTSSAINIEEKETERKSNDFGIADASSSKGNVELLSQGDGLQERKDSVLSADSYVRETHPDELNDKDSIHSSKVDEGESLEKKNNDIGWMNTELVDYREPVKTGYFRDQKRRIDLVIVVDDTGDKAIEVMKNVFFRNCLNAGLEFELEAGILPKNQGLVFVKVHAPDIVILALAKHYGVRKYFKQNHTEIMQERVHDERDFIKAVRYPGPYSYSTIERIYLVYRMLRSMPFGTAENFRGIERLVERGIVRDIYGLHDGPYYMVDQPDDLLNGRQALYETWVGSENVLKNQPINMIREYLGERIAFLFGFYEFYNKALLPYFLLGIGVFVLGFFANSHKHINTAACTNQTFKFVHWYAEYQWFVGSKLQPFYVSATRWGRQGNANQICKQDKLPCPYNYQMSHIDTIYHFWGYAWYWKYWWTATRTVSTWIRRKVMVFGYTRYFDLPVCPKCSDFKACPFVNMTKYCEEVKIKNIIDNPLSIYVVILTVLWSLAVALLWRQKENYFYWLWEVREDDARTLSRPEFRKQTRHSMTLKYAMKILIIVLMLICYVVGVLPTLLTYVHKTTKQLVYFYANQERMIRGSYFTLAMSAAFNGFFVIGLEIVYTKISLQLNRMMANQRYETQYEMSLTVTMVSFTLLVNFGFIFYVAFVKGAMYTFPSDEYRWYLPLGLGTKNCGMLSCIDELLITLLSTHICKKCFIEFDIMFRTHVSDMGHGLWHNQHIPCWEKEFDLATVSEADIMKKYNYLMLQMALVTLFAFIFPFAGLLAYLVNFFEIRYWSKLILVYSRRPMPLKTWGMGSWRRVLFAMPYLASICNIVSLTRLSNLLPRLMHQAFFPGTRYFADYTMALFNTSDFYNTSSAAEIQGKRNLSNVNSPAAEWDQYAKAQLYKAKHLYPHWSTADFCMFPNMYSRRYKSHRWMQVVENSYMPNLNYWHLMWYKMMLIVSFEQMTVLFGIIMHMLLDTCKEKVRNSIDVENAIKASRVTVEDEKKHN